MPDYNPIELKDTKVRAEWHISHEMPPSEAEMWAAVEPLTRDPSFISLVRGIVEQEATLDRTRLPLLCKACGKIQFKPITAKCRRCGGRLDYGKATIHDKITAGRILMRALRGYIKKIDPYTPRGINAIG